MWCGVRIVSIAEFWNITESGTAKNQWDALVARQLNPRISVPTEKGKTMANYIEREKIFSVWRSMPAPASVTSLSAAIHQTPAIDIVRCKECKHWEDRVVNGEHYGFCHHPNLEHHAQATYTEPEDFCSGGELGEPMRTVYGRSEGE